MVCGKWIDCYSALLYSLRRVNAFACINPFSRSCYTVLRQPTNPSLSSHKRAWLSAYCLISLTLSFSLSLSNEEDCLVFVRLAEGSKYWHCIVSQRGRTRVNPIQYTHDECMYIARCGVYIISKWMDLLGLNIWASVIYGSYVRKYPRYY